MTHIPDYQPKLDENQIIKVALIHEPPFVIYNVTSNNYNGVAIDILKKIQNENQQLTFEFNRRRRFGSKTCKELTDGSKKCDWNGIVGQLHKGNSDIAIGSLTNTKDRQAVVRFTEPFQRTKLGILIHVPQTQLTKYEHIAKWAFLEPFTFKLWSTIAVALITISVIMFLIDRISPFGYHGSYYQQKSVPRVDLLEKTASILESNKKNESQEAMCFGNSFYWAWSALCWQSPDTVPRSPSARIIAVIWYFCGVILITSYTAHLVTFLTHQQNLDADIDTFEDLLKYRDQFTVATLKASSVTNWLEDKYPELMKKINDEGQAFDKFEQIEDSLRTSTQLNKKFAVIWDLPALVYYKKKWETIGLPNQLGWH